MPHVSHPHSLGLKHHSKIFKGNIAHLKNQQQQPTTIHNMENLFSDTNIKRKAAFAVFMFFGVQFWRESSTFFYKWTKKKRYGSSNPFKFVIPGVIGTMMVGFSFDLLRLK